MGEHLRHALEEKPPVVGQIDAMGSWAWLTQFLRFLASACEVMLDQKWGASLDDLVMHYDDRGFY